MDPLLLVRNKIATHSLRQSYSRVRSEQALLQQFDQAQLDQQFDEKVYYACRYESTCTQYGDTSAVTGCQFACEGRYLVSVGGSGEGRVWQAGAEDVGGFGTQLSAIRGGGKLCGVGVHPKMGTIPAFAPNIVMGTNTGEVLVSTFDPSLKQQKCIKINAHSDRINSIAFHPQCSTFLTASYDKTWSIWDSSRLKQLSNQKGHHKQIHTLSIHPDGSLVLTGDLGGEGMIWDLRTGKGVYEFQTTDSIICSAFNPNGYEFAIGGKNNLINLFDIRRKKQLRFIPAHVKLVSDLVFSDDGAILFSGSHDMTVKMWHGRNYTSVGQKLEHPAKISSLAVYKDQLCVAMLDRKWTLWKQKKRSGLQKYQPVKMEAENSSSSSSDEEEEEEVLVEQQ